MDLTTKGFSHKITSTSADIPLTTLFSYTGAGMLKTMYFNWQNMVVDINVKLTIDNEVIFDGLCSNFSQRLGLSTDSTSGVVSNLIYNLPFRTNIKFELYSTKTPSNYSHELQAVLVVE